MFSKDFIRKLNKLTAKSGMVTPPYKAPYLDQIGDLFHEIGMTKIAQMYYDAAEWGRNNYPRGQKYS